MGKIYLEFENKLKQSDIVIPLTNSSMEEAGSDYVYNKTGIQQTSIYGILTPLIQINNIVVDFCDVNNFTLKSTGPVPTVSLSVNDRYNLISSIDTPGNDNELRIQILPQFDNAYKKINLTFYITKTYITGDQINISGTYKAPKLTAVQFKCLGTMDTYNLFRDIAIATDLGFATNCSEMNDERYIYCDHKSYLDILSNEISNASSDESHVYDWWIDLWNNITLANIYERYNTIEPEEEMMIWVSGDPHEMIEGVKVEPIQVPAVLHNLPMASNLELHVDDYTINNKSGSQISAGTDKVFSCYVENLKEYKDTLIQDGDAKKDLWTRCEYLGEVYGSYNYLLAKQCRDAYIQKLGTESVIITLKTPLLALMRGSKVNFAWYIADTQYDARMYNYKEAGLVNDNITIPALDDRLNEDTIKDYGTRADEFQKDNSISGQYMIDGQIMNYSLGEWNYQLILKRPQSQKTKILNLDQEENNNV